MFLQGAPEGVLDRCTFVRVGAQKVPMTPALKAEIMKHCKFYGTGKSEIMKHCRFYGTGFHVSSRIVAKIFVFK